jgi:plastocyanin
MAMARSHPRWWLLVVTLAVVAGEGAVAPFRTPSAMHAVQAQATGFETARDEQGVPPTSAGAVPESESVIRMRNDTFYYDYVFVPAGTTVTWINEEPDPTNAHNILAEDGSFASPLLLPGDSWQHTFTTPGYYRYFCELHEGMEGAVLVEEA